MRKRTKTLIIGIGIISILTGVYGIWTDGDTFNTMFGFVIGASLIGSIYFDQQEPSEEGKE